MSQRQTAREARKAQASYEQEFSEWTAVEQNLTESLNEAKTFNGLKAEEAEGLVLQLKSDELVFLTAGGAALVEPRRGPGTYKGGYQGFSFPIGDTGIRYRIGGSRGHFVQGEEAPTPVDTGVATITNQRIVFQGPLQTREWDYSKLLGYQHFDSPPWTALQVSNRQKTSGILYDHASAQQVQFRLALALAHFNHRVDELVDQLESDRTRHASARPTPPKPPPSGMPADAHGKTPADPNSASGIFRKWWFWVLVAAGLLIAIVIIAGVSTSNTTNTNSTTTTLHHAPTTTTVSTTSTTTSTSLPETTTSAALTTTSLPPASSTSTSSVLASPVVHPGAFCAPLGATGVTSSGTPMVCGVASDGRNRWKSA
jgi:hypothetical protein